MIAAGLSQGRNKQFCFCYCRFHIINRNKNHKFITADTSENVVGAEIAFHDICKTDDYIIAEIVPMQIIGLLEIINIENEKSIFFFRIKGEGGTDMLSGSGFVKKPRHFIRLDFLFRFQFMPFFRINIFPVGEHMDRMIFRA